ncbi:integrase core domain-containing protein [Sorangium sp. So ce1000]
MDALRRHGKPDALYLDNGSTYRGEVLRTACSRLGITLLHAKPYDPQARGKMERFWRTLREGCLSFLGEIASLKDIDARLKAFLERRYHAAPHAGLMGKSPAKLYAQKPAGEGAVEERALRAALTERSRRRVSSDNVLSIDGEAWELDQGYLAGQLVTVAHCHVAPDATPWVEHEGKRLPSASSIRRRTRGADGRHAAVRSHKGRAAPPTSLRRGRCCGLEAKGRRPPSPTTAPREVLHERVLRPILRALRVALLQGDPGQRSLAAALET